MVANALWGWLNRWKKADWQRRGKPIWAAEILQDIAARVEKLTVKVRQVDAHVSKSQANEEHHNNEQVDKAAKVKVSQGRDATYRWARDRGVDLTLDNISQVIHNCETCAAIKQAQAVMKREDMEETVFDMAKKLRAYADAVHGPTHTRIAAVETRLQKLEDKIDENHKKLREEIREDLLQISAVQIRDYLRSGYFKDPKGLRWAFGIAAVVTESIRQLNTLPGLSENPSAVGLLKVQEQRGWKHSPTICHGLTQTALEKGEAPEHLQYIDDIIVWGNTAAEVFEKGKKIIQILLEAGFAIKKSKVKGPASEIQFLGVKWQDGRQQIPTEVINKITAMSPPTNKK
ncbi:hypothetical protein DUI87_03084 [Hirundo rustica rustica]|uniref:ribonuclease H n=1 Tax=Hirundo rustica rustica TaxID=333673 RepID=A0A3M0LKA8_HIRRU|nr:hypothetical protein DUI87_03084 [Hirundo rustica rustica]